MGKTYLFYQINAKYLLESGVTPADNETGVSFIYDVADGFAFDSYSQLARRRSCPLFDQLRMIKDKKYTPAATVDDERALMQDLVFLDFSSLLRRSADSAVSLSETEAKRTYTAEEFYYEALEVKLYHLFTYGFRLRFPENSTVTFLPFERSAGMTRKSQLTFVRASLLDRAEQSIMLNLNLAEKEIPVHLSKYYAYRGLNLTQSQRCDKSMSAFMNERNTIVIDDSFTRSETVPIITNTNPAEKKISAYFTNRNDSLNLPNVFDGEGLMSPEAAQAIRADLKCKKDVTAVQFRLPFTKGMLFSVDFQDFLKRYICFDTDYEQLTITDAFGIERRIADVKIILTKTQFKAFDWLKAYADDENIPDIMQWYFGKLKYYKHAFYTVRTDASIDAGARFSYQYLNTLDIRPDAFTKVVNKSLQPLEQESIDLQNPACRELLQQFAKNEGYSWAEAVKKNPLMLRESHIRDAYRLFCRARIKEIGIGKIPISGHTLFLSRDLLALLNHIAALLRDENKDMNAAVRNNLHALKKSVLFRERFFAPNVENLNPSLYYAVYRSPHLSRNETCALRPYQPHLKIALRTADGTVQKINPHARYLSHLQHVLMIAHDSSAAATLAGADFDGDTVVLVQENIINKAVLHGAYEKSGKGYTRRIPVMEIRGGKKNPKVMSPDRSTFIRTQFLPYFIRSAGDCTGVISNAAITIAKRQYSAGDFCGGGSAKYRERAQAVWEVSGQNPAAFAGILAGLEIDAAKTELHPDGSIRDLAMLSQAINRNFPHPLQKKNSGTKDYYLSLIDKRSGALLHFDIVKGSVKQQKQSYLLNTLKYGSAPVAAYDSDGYNIDNLPAYFAMHYNRVGKTALPPSTQKQSLFDFDGAAVPAPSEEQRRYVNSVADTYAFYLSIKKAHMRANADDTTKKAIMLCLMQKYDRYHAFLSGCNTTATAALSRLMTAFTAAPEAEIDNALARLKASGWQYLGDRSIDARLKILDEILGDLCAVLPREQKEALFCDFRFSGYRLLYYFLLYAKQCRIFSHIDADREYVETDCPDRALFEKLCNVYNGCRPLKSDTVKKETALLREAVLKSFGGCDEAAVQRALRCCLMLKEKQKNLLVWDIFSGEEIAKNLTPYPSNETVDGSPQDRKVTETDVK